MNSVVRVCQHCMNLEARPAIPIMAELPAVRVTTVSRPFTFIGVAVTVRRKTEKRWGVLVTCPTTRAVHFNRRGKPQIIYSDKLTHFKGASSELMQALSGPPASPHMGGT